MGRPAIAVLLTIGVIGLWQSLLSVSQRVDAGDRLAAPNSNRFYFGDVVAGASDLQINQFESGFDNFVRDFSASKGPAHLANDRSCLGCHSVPMPGGSGGTVQSAIKLRGDPPRPNHVQAISRLQDEKPRQMQSEGKVRRAPPLFGLGLLEWVDVDYLKFLDTEVRRTHAYGGIYKYRDGELAKFGIEGDFSHLREFVVFAFAVELGFNSTSRCSPVNDSGFYPDRCNARISNSEIDSIVDFISLSAPPPRFYRSSGAAEGRAIFDEIGCNGCHWPRLRTVPTAPSPLNSIYFEPYTDLKLHDLGQEDLAAVRTSPLWGVASYGPPYWHDASAIDLESAIEMHAGEAQDARAAFRGLNSNARAALLGFLRSL